MKVGQVMFLPGLPGEQEFVGYDRSGHQVFRSVATGAQSSIDYDAAEVRGFTPEVEEPEPEKPQSKKRTTKKEPAPEPDENDEGEAAE